MSNKNRHKSNSNHPKPKKTLIDDGSTYSPNSIGGRIDLEYLRDKLFCQELDEINKTNRQNQKNNATNSKESLQGKGKA
jgi:hypothetical protein